MKGIAMVVAGVCLGLGIAETAFALAAPDVGANRIAGAIWMAGTAAAYSVLAATER